MPMFKWVCTACGQRYRVLGETTANTPTCKTISCAQRGEPMVRETGVTTMVVETRDNGVMPRKVEQVRDAQELRHQHAQVQESKDPDLV